MRLTDKQWITLGILRRITGEQGWLTGANLRAFDQRTIKSLIARGWLQPLDSGRWHAVKP